MVTDQAARGRIENQTNLIADLRGNHILHFRAALAEFFNDGAGKLFVDVNDNFFNRFQ